MTFIKDVGLGVRPGKVRKDSGLSGCVQREPSSRETCHILLLPVPPWKKHTAAQDGPALGSFLESVGKSDGRSQAITPHILLRGEQASGQGRYGLMVGPF